MERLIAFFYQYYNLLLFLLLEGIALWMLVQFNRRHSETYGALTAAWSGHIQQVNASVTSFFRLGDQNQLLLEENMRLRRELSHHRLVLEAYRKAQPDSTQRLNLLPDSLLPQDRYVTLPCRVLTNSVQSRLNYIVIDRGRRHGVKREMGLVSGAGVAAQVISVSDQYSLAMSLLNTDVNISARILGKQIIGTIGWDGTTPREAVLRYVPQHYDVQRGDTIVTSGFSSIFPEGFLIGHVSSVRKDNPDGFSTVRVRLATDFHRLDYLYLVRLERAPLLDSLLNYGRR